MPSMIAVGTCDPIKSPIKSRDRCDGNATFDLASGAHILGIRGDGLQGDPGDIRVGFGLRIERARRVADGGVRHSHPSVEPWTAAATTDYRDRNDANDLGTYHHPGAREG